MTNRELKKRLKRAVDNATPDMLEQLMPVLQQKEGAPMTTKIYHNTQQISQQAHPTADMAPRKSRRKWTALAVGLAACLLIAIGVGWFAGNWCGVDSTISVDVNPSVVLTANKQDKVLGVQALNTDAETVLDGMQLEGSDLKVAVNALIGSMVKHGYLDEARNSVLVSVENSDPDRSRQLEEELTANIGEVLQQNSIDPAVLQQEVGDDAAIEEIAQKYQVSKGRAALIQRVAQLHPNLTQDELAQLSISDLSLLLLAKDPQSDLLAVGSVGDGGYIGEQKAAEIAAQKVPGATLQELEFDYEDGNPCYEVKMYQGTTEYEFKIHAETGEVFGYEEESRDGNGDVSQQPPSSGQSNLITEQQAKEKALSHAGVQESSVQIRKVALDEDDGHMVYDVEFYSGGIKYEYEIDAATGDVRKAEKEQQVSASQSTTQITEQQAKEKALTHAGVQESAAQKLKIKLDEDDGRMVYEVEFYSGGMEYDYEVDASTGEIIQAQKEADD